ncbi:MAG: hypothetical protein OK438_05065 [Thaumarchaeota archaeon]|nr:hypothetical protein [Nitrososphaerota archaeon]
MKASEFAIAFVIILVAASVIGGMLYYFRNAPATQTVSETTPNARATTYSTEGFQETGSVSSVDSGGGHYSIPSVAFGNPLLIELTSSQLSLVQYGEDFEVRVTYTPSQQTMLEAMGKVIDVSSNGGCPTPSFVYFPQPCTSVALLDANVSNTIPGAWNPKVGGQVVLSLAPETSTPLIAITGIQSSVSTTESTVGFVSPACLAQTIIYGTGAGYICVFKASGQALMIGLTYSHPQPSNSLPLVSITESDSGFSVSSFQTTYSIYGDGMETLTLTLPTTDFIGNIHLHFIFS